MRRLLSVLVGWILLHATAVHAGAVGYSITITTAYSTVDPFPNRIDQAFVEDDTGYLRIANTGTTLFTGVVGTIAVSAFAGDLSFTSGTIVLSPGNSVSIAIPDDASDVGGFNGPAYFARPGVEITIKGAVSDGSATQPINALVADADIHSGVWRTAPSGLASDSFVLQGGDPWGFDPGDDFELSQADGVYVLSTGTATGSSQSVPEPTAASLVASGLALIAYCRRRASVTSLAA